MDLNLDMMQFRTRQFTFKFLHCYPRSREKWYIFLKELQAAVNIVYRVIDKEKKVYKCPNAQHGGFVEHPDRWTPTEVGE